MEKHEKLRKVVFAAALIALSVVLTRFVSVSVGDVYRFGFGKLPVVFASLYLGPVWGLAVGWSADVIGSMLTTGCNFLFTIPAALAGLLPWCIMKLLKNKKSILNVAVATIVSRVLTSGIILTVLLAFVYEWFSPITKFQTMLGIRLVTALVESTIESIAVYYLLKAVEKIKK